MYAGFWKVGIRIMKVVLIASYSGTSGANHSLVNLAYFLKQNHQVDPKVIIPRKGPVEEMLKVKGINYMITNYYSWVRGIEKPTIKEKIKWKIQKQINHISEKKLAHNEWIKNADLIHINAGTTNFGYKLSKELHIPLIWHIREFLEEDLNKTFWNKDDAYKQFSKAEQIICISESVKNKYENLIDSDNLIKIYNGVNTKEYQKNNNQPFSEHKTKLIIAGRIVREKGIHEAVEAIKIVKDYNENIELNIFGNPADEDYYDSLKEYINKQNLKPYINLIGYTNSIEEEWKKADIGLVCSVAEAFGRVTVEGMLAKALVIGANTAGTSELISDKYGLLYQQGNADDLAQKILWAIDNKTKSKKIIENAYKNAIMNFTAEENAKRIYQIYSKLLEVE